MILPSEAPSTSFVRLFQCYLCDINGSGSLFYTIESFEAAALEVQSSDTDITPPLR
jgi:hypothetical protein